MIRTFFVCAIIGLLLSCACRNAQTKQLDIRKDTTVQAVIDNFATRLEAEHRNDTTSSLSAIVISGNKILWSRAYGKADNEKKADATAGTVYRVGSISKTFTAYLMLLLVQDGVIRMDDPVANYLPEIRQLKRKDTNDTTEITFRELASHTGGLAMEPGLWGAAAGPIDGWETKVLNSIPTTEVTFPPGTKFSYSNIGFGILGLALCRAAHKPFIRMVEDSIFKPMGMTSSFYVIPAGFEDRVAVGYHRNNAFEPPSGALARAEYAGRGYKVPNGGIFTTPGDLARLVMAQYSDSDRLAKKYREMMQTIQTPEPRDKGYGFGLFVINTGNGVKLIGHEGIVAGYYACMFFNPAAKVGAIVLRNRDYDVGKLPFHVSAVVEGLSRVSK